MHAKSLQSCPTLCNPMDCSPPGSSVQHGAKCWMQLSHPPNSPQERHNYYPHCAEKGVSQFAWCKNHLETVLKRPQPQPSSGNTNTEHLWGGLRICVLEIALLTIFLIQTTWEILKNQRLRKGKKPTQGHTANSLVMFQPTAHAQITYPHSNQHVVSGHDLHPVW